ncbi:MAG TPA: MaoC family dehydratase [Candidatus Dormibacteraeota bacterium]|nr:MaoC family dehydratase [Candidatus Dormibacteraeota bacterium]
MNVPPQPVRTTLHIDAGVVSAWADLSGDHNRLHTDPEFAAGTRYGRCIAHGPILASMVGELLAGAAGAAWPQGARVAFRFVAPVFVPSTVTVTVAVDVDVQREDGDAVTANVACTDQDGTTVLTAVATWGGTAR